MPPPLQRARTIAPGTGLSPASFTAPEVANVSKWTARSGAEAVISNSYFADSAAQLRQMREQNLNFKLYSSTIGPALPGGTKVFWPVPMRK